MNLIKYTSFFLSTFLFAVQSNFCSQDVVQKNFTDYMPSAKTTLYLAGGAAGCGAFYILCKTLSSKTYLQTIFEKTGRDLSRLVEDNEKNINSKIEQAVKSENANMAAIVNSNERISSLSQLLQEKTAEKKQKISLQKLALSSLCQEKERLKSENKVLHEKLKEEINNVKTLGFFLQQVQAQSDFLDGEIANAKRSYPMSPSSTSSSGFPFIPKSPGMGGFSYLPGGYRK